MTLTPATPSRACRRPYYTVDGGAQQTYGAPFTVSAQGTHTVVYWSVDGAGNIEGQHTGYVNIDLTAPVTTPTNLQVDNHSGWRNASQTVSLSAADGSGSGVVATYYTLDGGAQQTYGAPLRSRVPATTPSSTGRSTRPATSRRRTRAT